MVTDHNIAFKCLLPIQQQSVSADVTYDAHLKMFRTTLVSAIFRQFGSCFEPFDFAG